MRALIAIAAGFVACGPTPDWEPILPPKPPPAATSETPLALRQAYIREFLTPAETPLTAKGWSPKEHVIPDPALLHGLRASSPAGSTVRAVAIVNAGVHPRWTFVFMEEATRVSVVATYTFWGQDQQKRAASVDRVQFNDVLEHLKEDLDCLPDPSPEYGIRLRALAYWGGDQLFVCDAFMKEGSHFPTQLDRILKRASITYAEPEQPDRLTRRCS